MAFINKVDGINISSSSLQNKTSKSGGIDFEEVLKKEIDETNNLMQKADETQAAIASGEVQDLAKASITIQKAEMKMKMMLEVRNKAINAYKELLKTQI
ncbi:MAG: flagellar hook-basal body complex protein FliE [Nautiliaceae bacterium]